MSAAGKMSANQFGESAVEITRAFAAPRVLVVPAA